VIFSTIRNKLLLSFIIFSIISAFIAFINYWFNQKREEAQAILDVLLQINKDRQTAKINEKDFFIDETINPTFYQTSRSQYLEKRRKLNQQIIRNFRLLKTKPQLRQAVQQSEIDTLVVYFTKYDQKFEVLVQLSIQRGFKDYGLEGKLRQCIHTLESEVDNLDLDMAKLLTIRRHEKDFMLRKDLRYVQANVEAIAKFAQEIERKTPKFRKNDLQNLLNLYKQTFLELVSMEQSIGLTEKAGLRQELLKTSYQIERLLETLDQEVHQQINLLNNQNYRASTGLIIICLLLNVLLAIYITQILSKPIQKLSKSIHAVIRSNFDADVMIESSKSRDEIGRLSRDFAIMLTKVQNSLDEIQQKNLKIEQKQQILQDSLNYAHKMQKAVLPTETELKRFFEDYLLIYLPMHTVSGDFYWLAEVDNCVFVAVVDCTGHGVPGAFLGMVANTLLSEIVEAKKVKSPSLILEILDMEIRKALKQEQSGNNDGMELGICKIEGLLEGEEFLNITFAGAKGKIFYQEDEQFIKYKGNKRAIGGKNKKEEYRSEAFEEHQFKLRRGASIYLISDGLIDQPNIMRKKFGNKRFVSLINQNINLSMEEQQTILLQELNQFSFQDGVEQRDDITILGLKLQ
jgi:serine phosphatase RsbU (regulator of sigma subunit)